MAYRQRPRACPYCLVFRHPRRADRGPTGPTEVIRKPVIVKPASILLGVAAFALVASGSAFAQSTDFGDREPSVDEIVKGLQSKPAEGVEGVQTRSLRPGAAVATKAAAPASASNPLQVPFGFHSSQIECGSLQPMTKLAAAMADAATQDGHLH